MKRYQALVILLLLIFFIFSLLSAKRESLTYDEIVYKEEGWAALVPHKFSVDPYNPPLIKELTVMSFVLGLDQLINSPVPSDKALPGRIAAILLGTALLFSVFLVTKSWFGLPQGIFAVLLLAFEPNILGNSHYLTLDVGFTLFYFLAYVFLLKFVDFPTLKHALFLGLTLGAALGSKISAIPYFFVSATGLFLLKRKLMYVAHKKYFFFALCIAIFTLWGTYFFQSDVIIVKHDNPIRLSSRLMAYGKEHEIFLLSWSIERLQNQKVPLGSYLSIIKNNIIRSQVAANTAEWYLMIKNILLKTPLPLLLLFLLSFQKRIIVFIIPVFTILFVSSLTHMSPWVRYVLPIYPFMAIVASLSMGKFNTKHRKIILGFLIFWYVIGTLREFPHFISYANELAGPKKERYKIFTDSNIDWGQSLPDLAFYYQKQKPTKMLFSYFGRDDGGAYGLKSYIAYGSYKFDEICAFHPVNNQKFFGQNIIAISVSNWYGCGYFKDKSYQSTNIIDIVGDSILIFKY